MPDGGVILAELGIDRRHQRFPRALKPEVHPGPDAEDQVGVVAEDEAAFTGAEHFRGVQADDRGVRVGATVSNPAAASITTASPLRDRNRSQPPTSMGRPNGATGITAPTSPGARAIRASIRAGLECPGSRVDVDEIGDEARQHRRLGRGDERPGRDHAQRARPDALRRERERKAQRAVGDGRNPVVGNPEMRRQPDLELHRQGTEIAVDAGAVDAGQVWQNRAAQRAASAA